MFFIYLHTNEYTVIFSFKKKVYHNLLIFKREPGTREKVRSKRINLEGNTHAQEINVSQLPV
jgi:hypothetical protein